MTNPCLITYVLLHSLPNEKNLANSLKKRVQKTYWGHGMMHSSWIKSGINKQCLSAYKWPVNSSETFSVVKQEGAAIADVQTRIHPADQAECDINLSSRQ